MKLPSLRRLNNKLPKTKGAVMKLSSFGERIVKQREAMHTSPAQLLARVNASPFGPKSKQILRDQVKSESTGAIGFALFECPPAIVRGVNANVFDADGKSYVDMLAGFSVSNIGHSHPEVRKAINDQAEQLIHYFDLPNAPRERLAKRLIDLVPGDDRRVAFGVAGSDSVDLAIKLARWYTGAPTILSAYGAYHGTSGGTMALTGKGGLWSYFYPVGPHDTAQAKIPYSYPYRSALGASPETDAEACLDYIRRLMRGKESPFGDGRSISNVAAIVMEPMQGSAGYIIPGDGYLSGLRELCNEFGLLLIMDEIQTGMGRSGRMWASEHEGVVPDMMVTSKGLASGLPISALVGRSDILSSWGPGAHVATFAATPLAAAAANATLDVYERDNIVGQAADTGAYFLDKLRELQENHPLLGWIDARGLFIGLELVLDRKTKEPAVDATTFVLNQCVRDGLLFEKGGYYYNRLQLIPPLTIEREQVDEAVRILDKAFGDAERAFGVKS
jgi:4-aminobutyrate aminotransferase-like enzyme